MKNLRILTTLFLSFFGIILTSCSSETEPINYGKDNCSFCKMTIMDHRFGSELVTQKGKIYKFDDISCMYNYLKTNNLGKEKFSYMVVSQFEKPNDFIDVEKAIFITALQFKSPMMGNTAAFMDDKKVEIILKNDSTAKVNTWQELNAQF